jgi:hypothetical protein
LKPNRRNAACDICLSYSEGKLRLKCDGKRAETRFRLSAKRTSLFKSAGALVQSTTGSRGVCISGSNAGYTMFRGSVKSTGYPLLSPVSPSPPRPCVTVCHHISTGLYQVLISAETLDIQTILRRFISMGMQMTRHCLGLGHDTPSRTLVHYHYHL